MLAHFLTSDEDTDSINIETTLSDEYYTRYRKRKLRNETLKCQENHQGV